MDIGLNVDFDGKKNIVMEGDIVKEYPIGGMICEYARLHPTELKDLIMDNPYFEEEDLKEKGAEALMNFYDALKEKYGTVTAVIVLTDFSNLLTDFNTANEEELKEMVAQANENLDENKVTSYILKDTGFSEFGMTTIGQAFLTAYSFYAHEYVAFKYSFQMLVSEEKYEEEQVMKFWQLYADNVDFQHIDFHIMFFDNGFHSVYTIKSSMSLILFEAAHVLDANTKFVKCKNCGNYFVPIGRSDALYCGYPAPQDESKNCRDVGAAATRAKKVKNDVLTQEYRRLYMRLKMALKRHPGEEELKMRFTELTDGMKMRKKQKEDGLISADDILEWLTSFDHSLNGD